MSPAAAEWWCASALACKVEKNILAIICPIIGTNPPGSPNGGRGGPHTIERYVFVPEDATPDMGIRATEEQNNGVLRSFLEGVSIHGGAGRRPISATSWQRA